MNWIDSLINPQVSAPTPKPPPPPKPTPAPAPKKEIETRQLTAKRLSVAMRFAMGYSVGEIAKEDRVGTETIRSHLKTVRDMLGLRKSTRFELARAIGLHHWGECPLCGKSVKGDKE